MSAIQPYRLALLCALLISCETANTPHTDDAVCFTTEILPRLAGGCAKSGCHNSTHALRPSMITPGNALTSELYRVLTTVEESERMPPGPWTRFDSTSLYLIKRWIEQGANKDSCSSALDTVGVTYQNYIRPLFNRYCNGCHYRYFAGGGPILTSYERVVEEIGNGSLLQTIEHIPGYSAMPPGSTRVTDREIAVIKAWIRAGMPN